MKRVITLIIVVALAVVGYFVFQRYQQQQRAQAMSDLETIPAERGSLTATVGATGTVRANQTALLTWQTTGEVAGVEVRVGDEVKAGQVLATLQQDSLAQNIILAEAEVASAQQALEDLQTQAEAARVKAMQEIVTFEQAVKDAQYRLDNFTVPTDQQDLDTVEALNLMKERLDKARAAFEPYRNKSAGDSTRQDLKEALDEAQADYNAAVKRLQFEYDLEVAQANLSRALRDYEQWKAGPRPADLESAQARVAAAESTLRLPYIEASFDGTITNAQPQAGDLVTPGTPAFRLDDLTHLLVDVRVSEVDINRIQVGQEVVLTFDAILGMEYHGQVTDVAQVGNLDQGVVDFTVTVELTDADEAVKPGMTSAVNIVVDKLENVLLVPNRAVRVRNGQRVVYVLRNNLPEPVEITLGATSESVSEVVDGGLQEGDPVVLNPPVQFEQDGPPAFMR